MADDIVIVDYGLANLRSVQKAFETIDVPAVISSDPSRIASADKIVLPGVGHFFHGQLPLLKSQVVQAWRG